MTEDLLHRFASSVLGPEYSHIVVRNDKLGSGIVAVDEQGPVHWGGLLTLHTVGGSDMLYRGLGRSSSLGLYSGLECREQCSVII